MRGVKFRAGLFERTYVDVSRPGWRSCVRTQ
jgi:hypothetical protein